MGTHSQTTMAPTPSFTGTWLLTDVQGDPAGFMTEMGVSWMMRQAASSMGYGKGKAMQEIKHDGDVLEVTRKGPKKTATSTLKIGETNLIETPKGEQRKAMLQWEDDVLVAKGEGGLTQRRYMEGDKLVLEIISSKGKVMKQVYTKQ